MTQLKINGINRLTKLSSHIARRVERLAAAHPIPLQGQRTAKNLVVEGARGLLRPGHEVRVNEHGTSAVLVKSPTRLKPGTRTELQLLDQRRILRGEIERCQITRLDPLCYEALFIFHQSVQMPETQHA